MQYLGFYNTSGTRTHVGFMYSTHESAGGNVAPSSAIDAADIRVYRAADGAAFSATQRSSSNGITSTSPFDSLTGFHLIDIDLTDNSDSGFYASGYRYVVVLAPDDETIDGQTITGIPLAYFEIGVAKADVTQWLGTAPSTPTVAGVPNVNAKTWNDLATVALPLIPTIAGRTLDVSATGEAGIDWANIGSPTTTVGLSGTTVGTLTTYTGNTVQTGDSYSRIGSTGSGLTSLAPSATALSTANWTTTRASYLDALHTGHCAKLIHNQTVTYYDPGANTDVSRGTSLLAAVAAAVDGDSVILEPCTFDLGTDELNLQVAGTGSVNLIGPGSKRCMIKGARVLSNADSTGPIVVLPINGVVQGIKIKGTLSALYQAPIGIGSPSCSHVSTTNAVMIDVATDAETDGLYVSSGSDSGNSTVRCFDCDFVAKYDCVRTVLGSGAPSIDLINCRGIATGPFGGSGSGLARAVACKIGTIRIWDGYYAATQGGATENAAIKTDGGVIEIYGRPKLLSTNSSGATPYDLLNSSGTITVGPLVTYDPSKTSGTISYSKTDVQATRYLPSVTAGAAGGVLIAGSNATTTVNITGSLSGSVGSVTGAVGSVTGNVGGNVTGSVGSISGVTFPSNFASLGINASGHISRVVLVDTLTTYTGNTVQTGDSFARIGATGSGLTSLAPSATALSTAQWTTARSGYLDNLNVGGNVASSVEVTAIQNNTNIVRVVPDDIELPSAGTRTYRIELLLYDSSGNMEAPDSAPTIALVNQSGTDRSSRLDSTTMALVSTGRYRAVYTSTAGDTKEQLVWAFSVVEGGATRVYGNTSWITDAIATDFTSADRTKLDSIYTYADVAISSRASQVSVDDIPTNAELATALAAADDAVLAAIAALNNLSQANVRTAVGLASANLDTQLAAIPTAAANATAVRTNLTTELARIDVATSTRLASASYTAPPSAASNATAVRTELASELLVMTYLGTAMELDGSVYRFTENALEEAPSSSGSSNIDPTIVDDELTWRFDESGQLTASNTLRVIEGFVGLLGMDFTEPLTGEDEGTVIDTGTVVSITPSGLSYSSTLSKDTNGLVLKLSVTGIVAGTYNVVLRANTVDSQRILRRGTIIAETVTGT